MVSFHGAVVMTPADAPSNAPSATIIPADELQWTEVKVGVKMAVIHGNPQGGAFEALFGFPAGMTTNIHTHPASLGAALLTGTLHREADLDTLVALTAGAVWNVPAGTAYLEKWGTSMCDGRRPGQPPQHRRCGDIARWERVV